MTERERIREDRQSVEYVLGFCWGRCQAVLEDLQAGQQGQCISLSLNVRALESAIETIESYFQSLTTLPANRVMARVHQGVLIVKSEVTPPEAFVTQHQLTVIAWPLLDEGRSLGIWEFEWNGSRFTVDEELIEVIA